MKMRGILQCTFLFLVVGVLCVLGDRKKCGPLNLCVCRTNAPFGFVKIYCTGKNVHLSDVCNFTSVHSNITTLLFNSIGLSALTKEDLTGCENIKELSLRNTSLSQVGIDAFHNIRHLNVLDLSGNMLDVYTRDKISYLYNLSHLTELRLNGNINTRHLTNATYPLLSGLSRIETLFLDGLPYSQFREYYRSLANLQYLRLSGSDGYCNLPELTNSTFENVPHLKKLCLSNCSIANVYAGTFKGLHNLTWLDLSINKKLGFDTFRNISYGLQYTRIDFLNMSNVHNTFGLGIKLKRQDVCFLRNTTLRELALDSNRIQLLETNLVLLLPDTLQVIHMRDNSFTFGLYLLQLACVANLTDVYMGYQQISHSPLRYLQDPVQKSEIVSKDMDDCIFDNSDYLYNRSIRLLGCHFFQSEKISKSDIYNAGFPNKLKMVSLHDSGFDFTVQHYPIRPFDNTIESVDFSGNILYSWTGPVGPFPSIKSLNLSRNYCSHVQPEMFLFMSSLERLYVQQNFLGIPLANDDNGSIFQYLNHLKLLDLSSNQIRKLFPRVFTHLQTLQMLNLSFNILSDWTADVQRLPDLQHLDLQSNALSELPQSLMSHFDKLDREHKAFSIDMRNNPFRCTCKYEKFLTWMIKRQSYFVGFTTYNFIDDSGSLLSAVECSVKVKNFPKTCPSFPLIIILCSVGVTLFISLIISGLVYKNRWKLRYLLYMNKRRFFGYRAVPDYEPIENYRYDAFISYAEENIRFILDGIIPKLQAEYGFNLCIHQRDFIAGNAVTDNIINAIQSSRKTMIILSRAFLKSKWCLYEFHMARMESIYSRDGKGILVIVMLESMPPNKLMPLEMIEWIKQESYIEYTDDEEGNILFWENIKQAIL